MSFYSQDYQPVYWSSSRCGKQTTSGRNWFFSALKVTEENLIYSWNPSSSQVCPGSNVPFYVFEELYQKKKKRRRRNDNKIIYYPSSKQNGMIFMEKSKKWFKFLISIFLYYHQFKYEVSGSRQIVITDHNTSVSSLHNNFYLLLGWCYMDKLAYMGVT